MAGSRRGGRGAGNVEAGSYAEPPAQRLPLQDPTICSVHDRRAHRLPDLLQAVAFALLAWLACATPVTAQVIADPWEGLNVEAVRIEWQGGLRPPGDETTVDDRVRRTIDLYPGSQLRSLLLDWGLGRLRGLPGVAAASANLAPGTRGGVVVTLRLSAADADAVPRPQAAPALPVLAQDDSSLLKLKFMAAGLAYGNHNAWYGQPDAFVGANPLADNPAGRGWSPWLEGAIELGLQGITPLGPHSAAAPGVFVYGSLSYLFSGSSGTELFTDEPRSHGGIEDAYAGIVFGRSWDDGSRLVVNLSAGRQAFKLADGMLIRINAGNGFDRAALQLNPRWAADSLLLAEARYNRLKLQAFRLDPDELPQIDSRTIIYGANLETGLGGAHQFGVTWLHVPQSAYAYYTATATGTRAGLQVADLRYAWLPVPPGTSGPFARAELAYQSNRANSFPMRAWAGYGELGCTVQAWPGQPTFSWRLSAFSGDDPATATYERWDPLLSGGTPEEWVQGINHYKMFQDSNIVAHRLQARLRPTPTTELVPQAWYFKADTANNLGGTLSTLSGTALGWELNLTAKYFPTRHLYFQAAVAATFPLDGVKAAVNGSLSPWLSAMLMARINY
jgi:hypothetical protein